MIDEVLSDLYGTVDGSVEWSKALQKVLQATGADRLSIASVARDGTFRQDSEPFDPEGAMSFLRDYADKDLRIARVVEGRRGVLRTQDVMSREEIAKCPVHNEFYRTYPECWNTMFATVEGESALIVPIIHRRPSRNEFSAEEGRTLDVISRHLARVVEMKQVLPSSTLSNEGIVAAYDSLDDGIVVFDQTGLVLHMNAAARAIAAAGDGIVVRQGVLTAADPASSRALLRMMTTTIRVASGQQYEMPKPIGLRRRSTRHPLIVRAYVVPSGTDANRIGVLKLQARSAWTLPNVATVQAATGLTASEARLAVALLDGDPVITYARRHKLSEHTVRTHLKHIREKLGVSRQSDVVALLARLCSG